MAIKQVECMNPASCLNKASMEEPIFVLRGNDEDAPTTVRAWAKRYRFMKGGLKKMTDSQRAKYYEALAIAEEMRQWNAGKFARVTTGSVQ